jgi:hypothetical protein
MKPYMQPGSHLGYRTQWRDGYENGYGTYGLSKININMPSTTKANKQCLKPIPARFQHYPSSTFNVPIFNFRFSLSLASRPPDMMASE